MSPDPAALPIPHPVRHLVIVLGDQLDRSASAFDGFDPVQDCVWMAEVAEESTQVWSAKQRTVLFLSAMRHFAAALQADGLPLDYRRLDDPVNTGTLAGELATAIALHRPTALRMTTGTSSPPCAISAPTPRAANSCGWSTFTASSAAATAC